MMAQLSRIEISRVEEAAKVAASGKQVAWLTGRANHTQWKYCWRAFGGKEPHLVFMVAHKEAFDVMKRLADAMFQVKLKERRKK